MYYKPHQIMQGNAQRLDITCLHSMETYEERYREQQIKYLQKKAAKLGFQIVPT